MMIEIKEEKQEFKIEEIKLDIKKTVDKFKSVNRNIEPEFAKSLITKYDGTVLGRFQSLKQIWNWYWWGWDKTYKWIHISERVLCGESENIDI